MSDASFPNGSKVRFRAGPRSTSDTIATVVRTDGAFLVTRDDAGKERKIRPGSCTAA